jgi:hypothetical protein
VCRHELWRAARMVSVLPASARLGVSVARQMVSSDSTFVAS